MFVYTFTRFSDIIYKGTRNYLYISFLLRPPVSNWKPSTQVRTMPVYIILIVTVSAFNEEKGNMITYYNIR